MNFIKTTSKAGGLNKTNTAISNLYSAFIKAYKDSLTNKKTLTGVLGLSDPQQKLLIKQANQALEIFIKIGEAYKEVKPLLTDDQPTVEDLNNIQQIILAKVSKADGITGFLKKFTKVKPFQGLDQESILNELFLVAGLTEPEGQAPTTDVSVTNQDTPTQETPAVTIDDVTRNKLNNLNKTMQKLSELSQQTKAFNTQSTQGNQSTTGNQQSDATKGTAANDETTGTNTGKVQKGDEATQVAQDVTDAGNMDSNQANVEQVKQVLQALQRAGYKITKQ